MGATPSAGTLVGLLRNTNAVTLRNVLLQWSLQEVADAFGHLPIADQAAVLQALPTRAASALFEYLPTAAQRGLILAMPPDDLAVLLNDMAPDDRTLFLSVRFHNYDDVFLLYSSGRCGTFLPPADHT